MSAEELVDEIMRAMESHPDRAFARRAAVEVAREALCPSECPMCGCEYDEEDE